MKQDLGNYMFSSPQKAVECKSLMHTLIARTKPKKTILLRSVVVSWHQSA